MTKHKIALSDDELRLIVDSLNWSKINEISLLNPNCKNDKESMDLEMDVQKIDGSYDPLVRRLKKTLGKD